MAHGERRVYAILWTMLISAQPRKFWLLGQNGVEVPHGTSLCNLVRGGHAFEMRARLGTLVRKGQADLLQVFFEVAVPSEVDLQAGSTENLKVAWAAVTLHDDSHSSLAAWIARWCVGTNGQP